MCFLKDMVLQNRDCLIRLPLLLTFVCIADVFPHSKTKCENSVEKDLR